jgi:hypothetical protein
MSIRVTWAASQDAEVASYDIERGVTSNGPWVLVTNVDHTIPGPQWDAGNDVFFYVDATGTASSFYRVVVVDSSDVRGIPSVPFRAGVSLCLATATFLDVSGNPARTTVIVSPSKDQSHSGSLVAGEYATQTYQADVDGKLSIPLLKGSKVVVAIEGTTVVREITVPTTDSFDLLQALGDAPDMFTVQTLPPLVSRRSF